MSGRLARKRRAYRFCAKCRRCWPQGGVVQASALEAVEFRAPKLSVLSNVDAEAYSGPQAIKDKLVAQLTSPVAWQQCMETLMAQGAAKYYEIGPGRVLAGLMRRIERRADFTSVNSAAAVAKLTGA